MPDVPAWLVVIGAVIGYAISFGQNRIASQTNTDTVPGSAGRNVGRCSRAGWHRGNGRRGRRAHRAGGAGTVKMYVTPSQRAAARLVIKLDNRRQRFDPRFLTAVANATRASANGRTSGNEGSSATTVQSDS